MLETSAFYIELAALTVKMNSRYDKSRVFCREYLTESRDADVIAQASEDDIEQELAQNMSSSREYCENICLYRSIAEQLPYFDRMVFHGAAVSVLGKGYIFTAPSGTGKSTHVKLLTENFGDSVTIINGDKPILEVTEGGVTVHSTPWAGKEGWQTNSRAPLEGIIILRRGKVNRIDKIEPSRYFRELMAQIYIPKGGEAMMKTLDAVDRLSKSVSFYLLECDVSEEAAKTSFSIMK